MQIDPRHPAHIAVFNVPMHGHVMPTLAVVRELVARGHRVSYAITPEFADQVRAAGAEPVLYEIPPSGEAPEAMASGVDRVIGVNLIALPQLEPVFADDRPDIVLYDVYAWSGPLLAARWGVPVVQLAPTHIPYEGLTQEFFGLEDIAHIPRFPELEAALLAYGLPGGAHALTLAPPQTIAFFPRTFQRRPDTVKAKEAHWVGPAIGDRAFQGLWQAPRDGRRLLYISLGTQFNRRPQFYRACMDAFADLDWHVVMSVGAHIAAAELGPCPPHIEMHASVPQLAVLAAASAFVTHGGMGSIMEALSHGVPTVVVPQMAEQRVNAAQVEELGLGSHLPREQLTGHALRAAVLQVAGDQRIAAAVASLRRDIEAAGGTNRAADVVEKMLTDMTVAMA